MPSPTQPSLENILLRNLTAAKDGDEEAIDTVCDALLLVRERDTNLVPLLRSILQIDDQTLKTYAANAAANLQGAAAPLVPDLIAQATEGSGTARQAAICALGCIPGKASVEYLVNLFETGDLPTIKDWVCSALMRHGPDVAPYIPRLEVAASLHVGEDSKLLNRHLNKIRQAARLEGTRELRAIDLSNRIAIYPKAWIGRTAADHFAPHARRLPEGAGLVHDERFPFVAGAKSEVGLQIYRTGRQEPAFVVVFTADEGWYGQSPQNVIEFLATAATHMFGLEPERTAWVERWTVGSGYTKLGHDEADLVRMDYDRETGMFGNPQWRRHESFEELLEELGASR